MELLVTAIREDPSLGQRLMELRAIDLGSESASTLMQVAWLLQGDCVAALVKLEVVCEDIDQETCAGAAALFECLGRGVCPQLKHLSIRGPSYASLPLLADALVLRGEVVKEGLESFGFRESQLDRIEDTLGVELGAALAKLVQAPCVSKLQKLELENINLGPWAAAIYLNSTPFMEHIKELRIGLPAYMADEDDEYVDDATGVEGLVTALAAGMYIRC
jgi:hypothetical protein